MRAVVGVTMSGLAVLPLREIPPVVALIVAGWLTLRPCANADSPSREIFPEPERIFTPPVARSDDPRRIPTPVEVLTGPGGMSPDPEPPPR
jgi:hypothetical protein